MHIGQKFGYWVVTGNAENRRVSSVCRCGTAKQVDRYSLIRGVSKSCGCYRIEDLTARLTTHGMSGTPVYKIWASMLQRVLNRNDLKYADYGGRGIDVDPRWLEFENFLSDMGEPPFAGASIDRLENDKGYWKENCRWASRVDQANNKRNNVEVTFGSRTLTISQWEVLKGWKAGVIHSRLRRGWSVARSLSEEPLAEAEIHSISGVSGTIKQHAELAGLNYNTVVKRMSRGATLTEALQPATRKRN